MFGPGRIPSAKAAQSSPLLEHDSISPGASSPWLALGLAAVASYLMWNDGVDAAELFTKGTSGETPVQKICGLSAGGQTAAASWSPARA